MSALLPVAVVADRSVVKVRRCCRSSDTVTVEFEAAGGHQVEAYDRALDPRGHRANNPGDGWG